MVSAPIRRPSTSTIFRSNSIGNPVEFGRLVERIAEQTPNTNNSASSTNQRNETRNESNRSADDTNNGQLSTSELLALINRRIIRPDNIENDWPQMGERLFRNDAQETERRINLCYRNLVDQYQSVVRRYCDISRNRDTVRFLF